MNNWKRKEEREISVADLVRKLIRSWKFILCCALICGVIFTGYKYYRDFRNHKRAEAVQPATEEQVLTPVEKEGIAYVHSLEHNLDEQDAYMEESILLKINPYQENRATLQYEIRGGNGDEALAILERYISYIRNGGVVSDLLADSDLEMEAQYLQELIRVEESASAYDAFNNRSSRFFSVHVIGEDDGMAEMLADAAEAALRDYGETLLTVPGQELVLLSRQSSVIYDAELEQKRNALLANRNAQAGTINALVSQFSEAQMVEYTGLSDEASEIVAKTETAAVGIDLKYMIVGIIIGIFVGCCWIIFCYLISNKIKSAAELEKNYDLCVYGTLKNNTKNETENILAKKQILARMVLNCHKNHREKLVFLSDHDIVPFSETNVYFQNELEKQGIKSIAAENMLEQLEMYEQLGDRDAVVILLEAERTAYPMLDKMLGFLVENGIFLSGVIVFEN